ncbi:MAG: hypothetical protein LBI72_03205 [Flavobacteriaceae bacterium]|jgi:hypothetical protein|nr:hypothetical protein [Flavobacteriaceae bacterium]
MSRVIIRRRKSFIERFRNFNIYLDGDKVMSVKNGEQVTLNISPGKHLIIVKIDWNTSNSIIFDIKEGQTIQYKVFVDGFFKAFYHAIARPNKYLILKEEAVRDKKGAKKF